MANPFEEDLDPEDREDWQQSGSQQTIPEQQPQIEQRSSTPVGNIKFGGDDQVEIKEGLLCPICVKEFPSIASLENHFQTAHASPSSSSSGPSYGNGSSFDPSFFSNRLFGNQLKGLLSKTRKKILMGDRDVDAKGAVALFGDSFDDDSMPRSGYEDFKHYLRSGQTMGPIKSYYNYFKSVRDTRIERYVLETNKLLIRLDKLVTDAPQGISISIIANKILLL